MGVLPILPDGASSRSREIGFLVAAPLDVVHHGGVPVSTGFLRRRLHVEVDRLASLKAAQNIKCLFQERIRHGCVINRNRD